MYDLQVTDWNALLQRKQNEYTMCAVTSSFFNPKIELMAIPGVQVLYGRASWYKTLGLSVCQEVGRNMKRERGYSLVAYHLCVFRGLNTHREGIYLD